MLTDIPKCPYCGKNQSKEEKKWRYNDNIEAALYLCKCGKNFNFYITSKGKTWTNPKPKDDL